jgi:hypothetical protein
MHDDIITNRKANQPSRTPWYLDSDVPKQQPAAQAPAPAAVPAPSTPHSSPSPAQGTAVDPEFADLTPAAPEQLSPLQARVQGILRQPMDRKKFLQTAGVAGLGVIGLGQILNILQSQDHAGGGHSASHQGYGSGAYGGSRTRNT